jgi:polar amino acid transport system substrate-binding protein
MRARYALSAIAATAALTLTLAGCVNNDAPAKNSSSSSSGVQKNDSIAAMLPAKIKKSGVLEVGMANNYPPNEYKDANGNPTGWSVDLTNAIGKVLGLKIKFNIETFDNILPKLKGGNLDMGMSSFTDTLEREKQVDFVDYFSAGIQWASPKGKTVDPDNACGLKVAVQATTYEDSTELPAKSKACTDAGKAAIQIFKYDAQDSATTALTLGQVDAMSADSPVTLYAIKQTGDKLQPAGDAFEAAPYGIPVAKDSKLTAALQKALQSMVDDGSYTKLLSKWGVESGGLKTITINAASKS